jgi:hypothetical protein
LIVEILFYVDFALILYLFINIKYINRLEIFILVIGFINSFIYDESSEFILFKTIILCFLIYQMIKVIRLKAINKLK